MTVDELTDPFNDIGRGMVRGMMQQGHPVIPARNQSFIFQALDTLEQRFRAIPGLPGQGFGQIFSLASETGHLDRRIPEKEISVFNKGFHLPGQTMPLFRGKPDARDIVIYFFFQFLLKEKEWMADEFPVNGNGQQAVFKQRFQAAQHHPHGRIFDQVSGRDDDVMKHQAKHPDFVDGLFGGFFRGKPDPFTGKRVQFRKIADEPALMVKR
jgi:hypothetical protein